MEVKFQVVAALLVAAMLLPACTKIRQFNRYFLSQCPEEGPHPDEEFDIVLRPVSLPPYLKRLREAAEGFSLERIADVPYQGRSWPIYHIWRSGPKGAERLVVVAGVHGNEVAGGLAASEILLDARAHPQVYRGLDVHLVAPANPVGLTHGSRYNAEGCDVNRDFGAFETVEARAIRDAIEESEPDLVLSLHEGPHDGFFVLATRSTPSSFTRAVATALRSSGVELATHSNLGTQLEVPGVMKEGWLITGVKKVLSIESLGSYAHERAIPILTTEGPWGERDIESRVRAQVLAVRAAAKELASGAVAGPVP